MPNVSVDDLSAAIVAELSSYNEKVTDGIKSAVEQVAKEVNDEIKSHILFIQRTGKYVKAFRVKRTFENKYNRKCTWHVAEPYYRLTHLLEYGHATRNGGRTKAYPHIKYGEELAIRRITELSKEAIESAGN